MECLYGEDSHLRNRVRGDQVFWAAGMKLTERTEFLEATMGELLLRHCGREAHMNLNELAEGRVETKGQSPLLGSSHGSAFRTLSSCFMSLDLSFLIS